MKKKVLTGAFGLLMLLGTTGSAWACEITIDRVFDKQTGVLHEFYYCGDQQIGSRSIRIATAQ